MRTSSIWLLLLVVLGDAACKRPTATTRMPIDLLTELPHAERRAAGIVDQAVRVDLVNVGGDVEPALVMDAPARVIYMLKMPGTARLRANVAVTPNAAGAAEGVQIRIGVSDDRFYDELLRRTLPPAPVVDTDLRRSLPLLGPQVEPVLSTGPADLEGDSQFGCPACRCRGVGTARRRNAIIAVLMTSDPLVIAGRAFSSRLVVGTGKYPVPCRDAGGARGVGHRDGDRRRPPRGLAGDGRRVAAALDRSVEDFPAAQHGRLLHRRGCRAHGAAGARGRAVQLDQARGDRRRAHALSGQRSPARRHQDARQRGLRRAAVHERRSDRLPQARGRGRRGGDAARRADRIGARHPESEQHPDHQGAGRRARHRGCGRRHGLGRDHRHGTRRRRRADEHGHRRFARTGADGRGDAARRPRGPAGLSRRPHSQEALRRRRAVPSRA